MNKLGKFLNAGILEDNMGKILQLLLQYGYEADGSTRQELMRIMTVESFPLPAKNVTFGGRLRFKGKNNHYVTVGKRTTCFYDKDGFQTSNFETFNTSDSVGIENKLKAQNEQIR